MTPINYDKFFRFWLENKNKKPNGYYAYQCAYVLSKGRKCTKDVVVLQTMCKKHLALTSSTEVK